MRFPRRNFLRTLTGGSLALPFLPSLAGAQPAKPPLRFIFIECRDGQWQGKFFPQAAGRDRTPDGSAWVTPLRDLAGPISDIVSTSFDPVRSKISLLHGLDHVGVCFHQASVFLGGVPQPEENRRNTYGSSVDCIIERSPGFYPSPVRIPAVRISDAGGRLTNSFYRPGGTGAPQYPPYMSGPKPVFDRLFQDAAPTPPDTTPNVDSTIADLVLADYQRLQASQRLGAEDRRRLATHLDGLRDLGRRLTVPRAACRVPTAPAATQKPSDKLRAYWDCLALAMACDLTRLAVIHIPDAHDGDFPGDVHANSHAPPDNADAAAKAVRWNRWRGDRVAELIKRLDAIEEADGSRLLDNTVVVWGNELARGDTHDGINMPVLVAGGGARLQQGQLIDYRRRPFLDTVAGSGKAGLPYTSFLIALMRLAGVREGEYLGHGERPGVYGAFDPDWGELARVDNGRTAYAAVAHMRNQPLPYWLRG